MADIYQLHADLLKHKLVLTILEKEGKYLEAKAFRAKIYELEEKMQLALAQYYIYQGANAKETEDNLFNKTLDKICSNDELVQFVFEELDAASQGNAYAKNFAKTSGIDPSFYKGALSKSSSVDREGGPQQFLACAIIALFPNKEEGVVHKINIVKKIIAYGFEKNILNKYKKKGFFSSWFK